MEAVTTSTAAEERAIASTSNMMERTMRRVKLWIYGISGIPESWLREPLMIVCASFARHCHLSLVRSILWIASFLNSSWRFLLVVVKALLIPKL